MRAMLAFMTLFVVQDQSRSLLFCGSVVAISPPCGAAPFWRASMNKHHHTRRATTFTALLHKQARLAPDDDAERAARIEALRKWRGLVVAGSAIALPTTAQQQQAAPGK
jgi:hypothetical protein